MPPTSRSQQVPETRTARKGKEKKCQKIRPGAETNCSISHEQQSLHWVCFSAFHLQKINSLGRKERGAKRHELVAPRGQPAAEAAGALMLSPSPIAALPARTGLISVMLSVLWSERASFSSEETSSTTPRPAISEPGSRSR